MSETLTLQLPPDTYQRLQELAQRSDAPLEETTLNILNSALKKDEIQAAEIEKQLDQLSLLTDEELWQAATTTASAEENELIQVLLEKQQREGLTNSETEQVQTLSNRFNQIMLIRAKSAVILSERGHNIAHLAPAS